ncbi:MAG: NUDIX hydrolase [Candidatus Hadarchaeales archaeon]
MMRGPRLAVDVLILHGGGFVLVKRKNQPYRGKWSLPGGFVKYGETVEEAARREAREETGLSVRLKGLLGVYSDPGRDPRGHVVSVCFLAESIGGELAASSDAADARVFRTAPRDMAFDHGKILKDAGIR